MSDFGHAIGVPPDGPGQPSWHAGPNGLRGGPSPWQAGPDRPDAPVPDDLELRTAHMYARAQADGGDLTGARTTIEEALASGELRLGRDDPELVPLMVDLATIARRLGNLTEARNQLRRAYAIVVPANGPEHPTSLAVEGRLSAVEYRLGEPTEAYDRHLVDVGKRVLGPEHPAVRGAIQRLERLQTQTVTPQQSVVTRPLFATPTLATPTIAAHVLTPDPPPAQPYGSALEGDIYEPARGDDVPARRGHGGGVALVVSLSAAVLIAGIVVALQLFGPGRGLPGPVTGQRPATTGVVETLPAPTGIALTDGGGTVTLTWTDPSDGRIPFVISGALADREPEAIETVVAGQTTTTIYGLNENFNYCFTVAAVWSADLIRESTPACTDRDVE